MYASISGESVPLKRGPLRINARTAESFLCSLSKCRQRLAHGRLLILGDSRAGKTSTLRSLVGESYDPNEERTRGVDTRLVGVDVLQSQEVAKENRWVSMTDSDLFKAETIGAKLVAEGVVNTRKLNASVRRTTNELYRSGINKYFKTLEPFIGYSTFSKVIAFYFVILAIVALLGVVKAAMLDFFVFLSLEIVKETKSRAIDFGFWLFAFHGLYIGIHLGTILLEITRYYQLQIASDERFLELQFAIVLLLTVEFLTALKIAMKRKAHARNFIDTFDIPPNGGALIHFIALGGAFSTSMSSLANSSYFSTLKYTIILVLRILYFFKLKLLQDSMVVTIIVFQSSVLGYGICYGVPSLPIFILTDLFVHCYGSWHYLNHVLRRPRGFFLNAVFNPPKYLLAASDLLTKQEKLEKEIAAIQSMKIQFVDFAGEDVYYNYHHLFLTDEAIYAIAFNAELLVGQNITQEHIKQQIKRICFWLESICIHASSQCPVILIATHCGDMCEDALKKLDNLLKQQLWDTFCHEIVLNNEKNYMFFPVENMNGPADLGICLLRQTILQTAENECETLFKKEVPFSWIKLEDKILLQRNMATTEKLCIKKEEFENIAKNCEVNQSEINTVLDYLYHKGIILLVRNDTEDPTWILLQPQLLVNVVIDLVAMPLSVRQNRVLRKDYQFLFKQGIITSKLFGQILSKFNEEDTAMKMLLEEYNLVCSIRLPQLQCQSSLYTMADATHFVPVMLPCSSPDGSVWIPQPSDKKFYVFFDGFFPAAVFHNLLSRAYKLNRLNCPNSLPEMRRDDAMFWLSPHQSYRLTILKEEGLIEVTISCLPQGLKPGDVLIQVAEMVNAVCRTRFRNLKFHCGPACPSEFCPGDPGSFSSLLSGQRFVVRRHVFNVYPRCKEGGQASFNCKNFSFDKAVNKWMIGS